MNRFTPRSQHLPLAGAFILAAAVLSGPSWPLVSQAAEPPRVPIPSAEELAARGRKGHPRLLASADDFAGLRTAVQTTEPLREWREKLERQAQDLWTASPARYEIPDGLRLLATSRRVLHRVTTLGLMYRLEQNTKHAERAWRELEAAAQFPDWNPRHFLDTAEMTHAFALGYDWLHDVWTPEPRQILRAAMTDKGLNLARDAYRGSTRYGGWIRARHNWSQVCNGGIGMGALALAEEAPELAGEILHGALTSLQIPMAEFAPDSAWNEGPGYWNYATSYNVVFLAALESALGSDSGLSGIPGYGETGLFPLYVTGPLGQTFNYADGGAGTIRGSISSINLDLL